MAVTVGTATSAYSEGTTVTVSKPSGVSDGDWLIAFVGSDWMAYSSIVAPAGWTHVPAASRDGGGTGRQFKTFTRQVSGDGASYVFDHADGVSTCCSIVPVFGAGATPTFTWALDATATTETAPSVVAGGAGDALICALYLVHDASSGSGSYTPPAGMTEVVDRVGNWSSMTVAKLTPVGSAGATGAKDFSVVSITKGTPEIAVSLVVADPGGGATDYTKTPADTAAITDARTVTQANARTPADSVTTTDTVTVVVNTSRTPADTIAVTDTDNPLSLGYGETAADPVGVTDSVSAVMSRVHTVADFLAVTDAASAAEEAGGAATPDDLVGVVDAASSAVGWTRGLGDVAAVGDTVVAVMERVATVADTVTAADTATHFAGLILSGRILGSRVSAPTARGTLRTPTAQGRLR